MAVRVGTEVATSQEPKEISRPWPRAISAPSGFAAMAVSQRPEESVRLAIPENMRKAPRRRRSLPSGVAPAAFATDSARG